MIPLAVPVGTWTLGPGPLVHFDSRPLAVPGTTVRLAWGETDLVVRVESREAGLAIGRVLDRIIYPSSSWPRGVPLGEIPAVLR